LTDWEQAWKKAEQYLDFMAFSRKGLIDQLEFEGFTAAESEFGVGQLQIDWKEQAWKKAEQYLEMMTFSRQGLIDQLKFEGFTHEEAVYGVDKTGL